MLPDGPDIPARPETDSQGTVGIAGALFLM
jgi:hypothetical protein